MDNESEISMTEFIIGDCNELTSIAENHNQIKHVLKLFSNHDIFDLTCHPTAKNGDSFRRWVTKATFISHIQQSRDLALEANKMYAKSIAFALSSNELALAYMQKSSLLLQMEKFHDCLQAVNCYFKLEQPQQWRSVMFLRKAECLIRLKSKEAKQFQKETLAWIANLPVPDQDFTERRLNSLFKHIKYYNELPPKPMTCSTDQLPECFSYSNPNEEIPSVANLIQLKYEAQFGRHYVAAEDIRPGTCLAKVAPYVQVLNISKRFLYCWGCLKFMWNCVPCENCNVVVFCTDECRIRSWKKFHDLECEILPYRLAMSDVYRDLHIVVLRMMILAVKEFGGVEELRKKVQEIENETSDPRTKGFTSDGLFKGDSYLNVYSLMDTTAKISNSMKHCLVYLTYFLQILANKTTFFGRKLNESWLQLAHNEDVLCIGGLLLKNLYICNLNGLEIKITSEKGTQIIGTDVVPSLSFLNHSCNSSVDLVLKNGHRILFATDSIKKGEQIYIRYTRFDADKVGRQVLLRERYLFDCTCIACKQNWPRFTNFPLYEKNAETAARTDLMKLRYLKVQKMFTSILTQGVASSKDLIHLMRYLRNVSELSNQTSPPYIEVENIKCVIKVLYDKCIV